jgi:hypothetical protein
VCVWNVLCPCQIWGFHSSFAAVFCDLKPCWLTLKMKALIFWKASDSYQLTWHNVLECMTLSTLPLLKNKSLCVFGRELGKNFWSMLLWIGVRMEIMRYASFCIEVMIAYWYSDWVIGLIT